MVYVYDRSAGRQGSTLAQISHRAINGHIVRYWVRDQNPYIPPRSQGKPFPRVLVKREPVHAAGHLLPPSLLCRV